MKLLYCIFQCVFYLFIVVVLVCVGGCVFEGARRSFAHVAMGRRIVSS